MKDQINITIQKKLYLNYDQTFLESQTEKEFYEWAGGRLATGLFKGEFEAELYNLLMMAQARGKLNYHKELLKK